MAGERTSRLSVDEAKEKLKRTSHRRPVAFQAGTVALDEARRRPWAAAGVALALGVAIGASSTARRVAVKVLQRALSTDR